MVIKGARQEGDAAAAQHKGCERALQQQALGSDLGNPTSEERYSRSRARGCRMRGQSTEEEGKARSAVCRALDSGDTTSSSGVGLSPFAFPLAFLACSTPTSVRLVSKLHTCTWPITPVSPNACACAANAGRTVMNPHQGIFKARAAIWVVRQVHIHCCLAVAH